MNFFHRSIPTYFNERKATSAATLLLQLAGSRMEHIRLLKLLYLADRAAWARYGRPITGDMYVSMKHGPVLSKTYRLIQTEGEEPEPTGSWQRTIVRVSGHEVALRGDADLGPLSEAETDILAEVHHRYLPMPTWGTGGLIEHLHQALPEWKKNEEGAINISPEDILKALGKGNEIPAVRKSMEEFDAFQRLLGVH